MSSRPLALLALVASAFTPACDELTAIGPSTCSRSESANEPILYTEGKVEDGIYMTSDFDAELLYFPGGMRYRLQHGLGERPKWWNAYLSFDRYGTEGDAGTVAEATGNQVEVPDLDETTMTVINASCSEYWLLVVAGTGNPNAGTGGSGGGGGGSP